MIDWAESGEAEGGEEEEEEEGGVEVAEVAACMSVYPYTWAGECSLR